MSVPTIILSVLLFTKLCLAQQPDEDAAVPENFPKAFITAMAVAIICTVIVVTLVCVLAHCWQYILGARRRGVVSLTLPLVRERWLDPVFEWPQRLAPRPRKKRERKRRRYNMHRFKFRFRFRFRRRRYAPPDPATVVGGEWMGYSRDGIRGWV
ncbi:hypothetical protein F5Y04DRAFT_284008 [Hypomontagnella monticulosa]|nr:hypothetical protein F5Y04DRAFT_284008 [Hypomontagnella monticulosa]